MLGGRGAHSIAPTHVATALLTPLICDLMQPYIRCCVFVYVSNRSSAVQHLTNVSTECSIS